MCTLCGATRQRVPRCVPEGVYSWCGTNRATYAMIRLSRIACVGLAQILKNLALHLWRWDLITSEMRCSHKELENTFPARSELVAMWAAHRNTILPKSRNSGDQNFGSGFGWHFFSYRDLNCKHTSILAEYLCTTCVEQPTVLTNGNSNRRFWCIFLHLRIAFAVTNAGWKCFKSKITMEIRKEKKKLLFCLWPT